ncbi:MAG: SPOR domain-containing protein, partial [Ignavibacteria bacterium]|nr:SPOR domain-containing protein [Ignavibacteria bacterium]
EFYQKMKTTIKILLFSFLIAPAFIIAQEIDIVPYLKMIEQGKLEDVKAKLLDLKTDYPKSANLIFLEGVLTENGQDAVALYQTLAEKFPKSAYADAAIYRLYSYYFALGLYNTADKNLDKLKKDYPESPYIKMATANVVKNDIEESDQQANEITTKKNDDDKQFRYSVQAGAFTNSTNAAALKKEIESAGMISFIKEKNVAGTIFNVVYIGKFETKKEAEDFLPIASTRFRIAGRVVEINQ